MANEKRERQRANRDVKRELEKKAERRAKILSTGRRVAIWAVVAIVVLILANLVFGPEAEALGLATAL